MNDEIKKNDFYSMVLQCFRSEQMSAEQLFKHMTDDPGLKKFIERELSHITSADNLERTGTPAKNKSRPPLRTARERVRRPAQERRGR